METELERLVVRLLGDATGYQKMLQEVQGSTSSTADDVEKSIGKIEKAVDGLKGIAESTLKVLGAVGLGSSLRSFLNIYSVQEDAEIRLRASIRASGLQVRETMQEHMAFASQLQQNTEYGDEYTLGLLAQAYGFRAFGRAAQEAVTQATALAAASSRATPEGALRVTAAMASGNIQLAMQMSRMIPELRGVRTESEFAARYQQLLASGTETMAERANTAKFKIQQLSNALGDLQEQLGAVVADYIKPTVVQMRLLVERLQTLDPAFKKLVVTLIGGMTALLATGPFLAPWVAIFTNFGKAITNLGYVVTLALAPLTGVLVKIGMAMLFLLNPLNHLRILFTLLVAPLNTILGIFLLWFSPTFILARNLLSLGGVLYVLIKRAGGFAQAWQIAERALQDFWVWLRPIRIELENVFTTAIKAGAEALDFLGTAMLEWAATIYRALGLGEVDWAEFWEFVRQFAVDTLNIIQFTLFNIWRIIDNTVDFLAQAFRPLTDALNQTFNQVTEWWNNWSAGAQRAEGSLSVLEMSLRVLASVAAGVGIALALLWEGLKLLWQGVEYLSGALGNLLGMFGSWERTTTQVTRNNEELGWTFNQVAAAVGVTVGALVTLGWAYKATLALLALLRVQQLISLGLWAAQKTALAIASGAMLAFKGVMLVLNVAANLLTISLTALHGAMVIFSFLGFVGVFAGIYAGIYLIIRGVELLGSALFAVYQTLVNLLRIFPALSDQVSALNQLSDVFGEWYRILERFVQLLRVDMGVAWEYLASGFRQAISQVRVLWPPLWTYLKDSFKAVWSYISEQLVVNFEGALATISRQTRATIPRMRLAFNSLLLTLVPGSDRESAGIRAALLQGRDRLLREISEATAPTAEEQQQMLARTQRATESEINLLRDLEVARRSLPNLQQLAETPETLAERRYREDLEMYAEFLQQVRELEGQVTTTTPTPTPQPDATRKWSDLNKEIAKTVKEVSRLDAVSRFSAEALARITAHMELIRTPRRAAKAGQAAAAGVAAAAGGAARGAGQAGAAGQQAAGGEQQAAGAPGNCCERSLAVLQSLLTTAQAHLQVARDCCGRNATPTPPRAPVTVVGGVQDAWQQETQAVTDGYERVENALRDTIAASAATAGGFGQAIWREFLDATRIDEQTPRPRTAPASAVEAEAIAAANEVAGALADALGGNAFGNQVNQAAYQVGAGIGASAAETLHRELQSQLRPGEILREIRPGEFNIEAAPQPSAPTVGNQPLPRQTQDRIDRVEQMLRDLEYRSAPVLTGAEQAAERDQWLQENQDRLHYRTWGEWWQELTSGTLWGGVQSQVNPERFGFDEGFQVIPPRVEVMGVEDIWNPLEEYQQEIAQTGQGLLGLGEEITANLRDWGQSFLHNSLNDLEESSKSVFAVTAPRPPTAATAVPSVADLLRQARGGSGGSLVTSPFTGSLQQQRAITSGQLLTLPPDYFRLSERERREAQERLLGIRKATEGIEAALAEQNANGGAETSKSEHFSPNEIPASAGGEERVTALLERTNELLEMLVQSKRGSGGYQAADFSPGW